MIFRSLCSGIEAASVAWHPLGWRADGFDASEDGTGRGTPIILVLNQQGRPHHADAAETDTSKVLRRVRDAIGEEAFAKWGLGILDSLHPPEILRSALHGSEFRPAAFSRRWVVHCALSREKDRAEGAMHSMREAKCDGRASQGWRPPEQLSHELGACLSELSQPGAQAERLLCDLRQAAEGAGLLLKALAAIQETRRPTRREDQSAPAGWRVRRLTVEECEFLQGFPRSYTDVPYGTRNFTPDGPRYKALGNSMAVNVMRWIGRRIEMVDGLDKTRGKNAA